MAPTDAPATFLAFPPLLLFPGVQFPFSFLSDSFPLPFILSVLFLFLLPLVFHVDKHSHATPRY